MTRGSDVYTGQAPRYDSTRGVSTSILTAVLRALEGAPGRELFDIGGGTGNYAAALRKHGWSPTVIDRSPSMLEKARAKGLPALEADATSLPLGDGVADAVTMISMLHQVADWRGALREARRILRPGGRLAVMLLTADHIREVSWVYWWFPSMGASALARRPSIAELLGELPGGQALPLEITDLEDGSIAALCRFPERILDPAWRHQTTFFEQLARTHPEELDQGLRRLHQELESGRRPDLELSEARSRLGDAIVLGWRATPRGF
jgi:SAM-dependent methyltransferase